jgi:hypothetical protein
MPREDLYDDRQIPANYCGSHCVQCDLCFVEGPSTGEEDEMSFAAHTQRDPYQHLDPEEVDNLQVRTYEGYCKLSSDGGGPPADKARNHRTIWEHVESDRKRAGIKKLKRGKAA